jgi:hypothetical protein
MKVRRHIPAVLHNFLESFASRNSDYRGYWLFGFLVSDILPVTIDLLHWEQRNSSSGALASAGREATKKFREQAKKAGIPLEFITSVALTITKVSHPKSGEVNGYIVSGYDVSVAVEATTDQSKTYWSEKLIFVAPHDPDVERRSLRNV